MQGSSHPRAVGKVSVKLSRHFALAEMVVSQEAARHAINNNPPPAIIDTLRSTCEMMESVRALLGDKPIIVSSGYRCRALNDIVGGSVNSAHMRGHAVDFICPGFGTPLEICRALESSGITYDQLIHEFGAWAHISFAPTKRGIGFTYLANGRGKVAGILQA